MEYILRQVFITLTLLTLIQISSSQGGDGGFTDWTQWTAPPCDVTCGQNVLNPVFRERTCRFTPSNCTIPFIESKQIPCTIPRCPVDGGYSPWGSWVSQACSATCQGMQQVRRTRLCDNPSPQFNGRTCQGASEEIEQRSCGDEKCPGEDLVSQWSAWSSPQCQVTCGGASGIVTRTRQCVRPDNTTIGCTANLTESEMRACGPSNCPVHGGVSEWDKWDAYGPCSPSCGANGTRKRTRARTRTCTNPVPAYGGRFCAQPLVDTDPIPVVCDPVPCQDIVSFWTSWEVPTCQVQATCGVWAVVTIARSRSCDAPANGVSCSVSLTETRPFRCGAEPCPAINGGMSMWSVWGEGPCSATCGTAVRNVIRNRNCTNPAPQYGGDNCREPSSESMTRTCTGLPSCPSEDLVSQWSAWSSPQCQVTCGGASGIVTRARLCAGPDNTTIGCTANLTESEMRACGPSNCPAINGGMSMWSVWGEGPCSATCGPAVRNVIRNRNCTNPAPQYGGDDCREPSSESMTRTCTGLPSCPTISTLTGGILVGVVTLLGILLIFIIIGILWCVCCRKDEVRYKEENIRQSEFHQYHNVKSGFLKPPYYNLEK